MQRSAHALDTPVAVPFALAICAIPVVLAWLIQGWHTPSIAWAPLTLLMGLAILGWRSKMDFDVQDEIAKGSRTAATATGVLLLAIACFCSSVGVTVIALASVGLLAAFAVGGKAWFRAAAPIAAFAASFASIPILTGTGLSAVFQTIASKAADKMLDLWNVFHAVQGSSLLVSDRRLFLDEAVRGVHPMAAVLVAAAFGLAWARRPWWVWIVVLGSVPFWTLAVDGLRRALTALAVDQYRLSADRGAVRMAISLASIAMSVGLTFSFSALLQTLVRFFNRPSFESKEQVAEVSFPRRTVPAWVGRSFVAAAVVSLVIQSARWVGGSPVGPAFSAQAADLSAKSLLPDSFAGIRQTEFRQGTRDRFGVERGSVGTWEYKSGWTVARFDVERSVGSWRELPSGFRSTGWILRDRVISTTTAGDGSSPVVEISMNQPATGRLAKVWQTLASPGGRAVGSPGSFGSGIDPSSLLHAVVASDDGPCVQLTLSVEGASPLDERSTEEARKFFEDCVRRVLDAGRGKAGGA